MSSEHGAPLASPPQRAVIRALSRPVPLVLALGICTFIPIVMAAFRVVQIPLNALPEDSLRLAVAPIAYFLHALAGVLFGVLGPLQFVRALRSRFGALHGLAGRAFVLTGSILALSGLGLLLQVESITTALLDAARGVFGIALLAALVLGVAAARAQDLPRHRAWMIRAYAIGMGTGIVSDIVVVGIWLMNIVMGEWVVRRLELRSAPLPAWHGGRRSSATSR
jgi:uncharacterized membrane protein